MPPSFFTDNKTSINWAATQLTIDAGLAKFSNAQHDRLLNLLNFQLFAMEAPMSNYRATRTDSGQYQMKVNARGYALLTDPLYNKGTGFTEEERDRLGLQGLLPAEVNSMDNQAQRVLAAMRRKQDAIEKFIGLTGLQDRNEHMFYKVLTENFEEFMPIVYTPTVGQACQEYSRTFRRSRGLWITPAHRGRIKEVLRNARSSQIRLTVVTDNEAILGIGDQGAGGIAISVGKLALYCAGAGIHPAETLPISLDTGTDNQELLDDPLYLGWRHNRLRGDEYDSLVDEFVEAVSEVFPGIFVQWEDFKKNTALAVLERYRDSVLSFNDDIQGTGAVALAALISACRQKKESLKDQRIVIFGAGAAGIGITRQLRAALIEEGLSETQARQAIAAVDSGGLVADDRELRDPYKKDIAWTAEYATEQGLGIDQPRNLEAIIEALKPTVLIGSSGQAGAFSEGLIRKMAAHCKTPVVLPFSNPTHLCEAVPADIIRWTDGRALIATGSPFEPVDYNGRRVHIGQGNNVYIFPGLGLGALSCNASKVTDGMITASARALAESVSDDDLAEGRLFPPIPALRQVCKSVAGAVIKAAIRDGVSDTDVSCSSDQHLESLMWTPEYPELITD